MQFFVLFIYIVLITSGINGLIINLNDGLVWFLLALFLPPFAVVSGFLGFLQML